ncbi:MAG: histidine ammonia-lyase, partial [Myxococcales bacterium]|nr:histidine ammonia-lyase [Myxococcales bacterium]
MAEQIHIGDNNLTLDKVVAVAAGQKVALSTDAKERIAAARELVETKLTGGQPVYGVTTGFGALAETNIPHEQLCALQENLILSHAAGVGNPLSRKETRAMLALRAQTLATGRSGA